MIITINDFGGGSGSGKYEVVTELPSSGKTGTIYLAPSENPQEKNIYNEYVYVNGDWEQFGEKIDLSNYYDKTETDNLLNNKQDVLVSGENIKTINGEDVLGEGDIEIKGDVIKGGDGIYISEDAEGAKVISTSMPKNEIWYTSTNNDVVNPRSVDEFGANIISNTYINGKGIIKFDGNVTTIGVEAFNECSDLTSIEIPNSVTSINDNAFSNCESLSSVTIPNSVTSISQSAFGGCSNLTSIEIPNSVTSINDSAFNYCSSLSSVTIGNSVTTIGGWAFSNCESLTSIEIPNSVTSIGYGVFQQCSGLKSVTIGNSVTTIGGWAFSFCSNLTSIEIPNSVTSIGSSAFAYSSKLTNITIPNSVTSIDSGVFQSCTSLTSIEMPNSVTSIGSSAFNGLPTSGTLYCDEDWFNNLDVTSKGNLYNVANWTRKPLPKPIEERVDDLEVNVTDLTDKVNDLQLYKFPNATIFGQPTINNGQVSNFSNSNYLQFPFLVDFQNRQFNIRFSFTTPSDMSGQQNILDSNYGLAFAIRDGKVVCVASDNGTSWTTGELISDQTLIPNTTYYFRIYGVWLGSDIIFGYWGGLSKVQEEMTINKTVHMPSTPYPKTMVIGRSYVDGGNYYKGSINLNDASLEISNKVVWQGMDDVGLATRLAVDLSNLDDKGKEVIDDRIDAKIGNINSILENIIGG